MKRTEPIRNPEQVRALLEYYRNIGMYRNHVLITIGVYTALRISDILLLKTDDVYDYRSGCVREAITITEKKTGKTKTIALHQHVMEALYLYLPESCTREPLIMNNTTGEAISRIQAYRLIDDAAKAVGIEHRVSCHSLRKTFGYHSWHRGISPVLLMEIYNHSSYAVTKRYLGVTQDDQNAVYRGFSV